MRKAVVEIKKPCMINLDAMASDSKGKFCSVCETSVVDFTNKSPEEILVYFQHHQNKKTCGIYNSCDVKTNSLSYDFISFLYSKKLKFLTLFISGLLILTGCKIKRHGKRTAGVPSYSEKTESIEHVK